LHAGFPAHHNWSEMMADPVTLATVTAAVTTLGLECAKSVASEAGKSIWGKVKSLFGWASDPAPDKLAHEAAEKMAAQPDLLEQVVALLKAEGGGTAGQLVGRIKAKKVVVAETIVAQTFKM
jgi:hypothetical protein